MAISLTQRLANLEAPPELRLLLATVDSLPTAEKPNTIVKVGESRLAVEASLVQVAAGDNVLLLELRGEKTLYLVLFRIPSVVRRG